MMEAFVKIIDSYILVTVNTSRIKLRRTKGKEFPRTSKFFNYSFTNKFSENSEMKLKALSKG